MILYNDRIITNSVGKWAQRPLHMVTTHGNHGSVNANPNKGEFGTNVTLSNTPDTGYRFTSYSIAGDGASLSGNTLIIGYSDVSVTGNFGLNSYNITYSSVANGSFSGPSTAEYTSTVTVTSNPTSGYKMDYITVNGVRITGNTFTMPAGPVTISGSFAVDYNPLNLPANIVRVRTNDGNPPIKGSNTSYETATRATGSIYYDVYKSGTDFSYLLANSTNVDKIIGANTKDITNMSRMFSGLTNLNEVALFDTSKVTTMSNMFNDCSTLTSVPKFDTSSVTSMYRTFRNCSSLTTIPLFNTSSVTDMDTMFYGCTSLTSVPLLNTANVTTVESMFSGCTSLTTIPLINTSKVISMVYFCANCKALTRLPLFNTSKAVNVRGAFGNCWKVQSGALALYNQMINQTNPPSTHSECFYNCGRDTTSGAAELAQIPSDWK